jgi:hypothetical protein
MLKNLLIFVLLLGLFAYAHGDDRQPAASAPQSQKLASPTAPAAADEHNSANLKQAGPQEQAPRDPETVRVILPPKDHYDYILFAANILLVIVGFCGVGIGLRTLGWLKVQTIATKDAANAAKDGAQAALKQANHMVASERAWVMAELRFQEGNGISWGTEGGTQHTMAGVILSIKNSGPTPAWVYEQCVRLEVSPKILTSLEKYESPNFPFVGEGNSFHANYEIHPLTQGDNPVGWKAYVFDEGISTPENGLHVYIYGVVRYRDAFESKRETYFGYVVQGNNRLERIPNEAYNKHT